jgi:hypothetical protein
VHVALVDALDAAAIGGDRLREWHLEEVRGTPGGIIEHRLPVEFAPAVVVVDGGIKKRLPGRGNREPGVAPVLA